MRIFATGALQSLRPQGLPPGGSEEIRTAQKHMQQTPRSSTRETWKLRRPGVLLCEQGLKRPGFRPKLDLWQARGNRFSGIGLVHQAGAQHPAERGQRSLDRPGTLEVEDVQNYVRKNEPRLLALARNYKIENYALLGSPAEIKTALFSGMRVVFSAPITVFETDEDGLFRCTINNYGGHAMSVWGYDGELFRVQNSWGTDWGENGRCWMLAEDILRWNDCWAITDVPSKSIIKSEIREKAVRYVSRIRTKTKGGRVILRKSGSRGSPKVGGVKDGAIVLVIAERGARREICFSDGKTYHFGWIPASYINPGAGYRETDEEP